MNNGSMAKPIRILLAEDNPGDVRLVQEVFKEGKVLSNMSVVKDGVQALECLRGQGAWQGKELPDIILLDLNLPKKNGRDVLAEIKTDAKLKHIPVIILTSSEAEEDIAKAYELHGNCYITKPVDVDKFIDVVKRIENFWLTVVKLPGATEKTRA